jgi:hypothetical protein
MDGHVTQILARIIIKLSWQLRTSNGICWNTYFSKKKSAMSYYMLSNNRPTKKDDLVEVRKVFGRDQILDVRLKTAHM